MELKTAIERVERFATAITWANDDDRQALALVLEAAKRPGLGEEDRETLQALKDNADWMGVYCASQTPEKYRAARLQRALAAAAILAKLDAYLEGLKGQSE